MTTVLKLGGSVITDKERPETLDGPALDAAARAIASATATPRPASDEPAVPEDLVVVHGGGSFGHHHADTHHVTRTEGTRDQAAVHAIHGAMTTLNSFVVGRLHERAVPAVPVHPLSAAHRDADGDLHLPAGQVETLLAEGFVPVLHGDGVAHRGEGVTVLSGDEVVVDLARSLDAERVGLCSTVPGVLDAADEVIERVERYEAVADVLGESAATDVSGGMAGKVRELLDLDVPASIFGLSDLEDFLAGDRPGTTVGSTA